jgi:hypothetical protein
VGAGDNIINNNNNNKSPIHRVVSARLGSARLENSLFSCNDKRFIRLRISPARIRRQRSTRTNRYLSRLSYMYHQSGAAADVFILGQSKLYRIVRSQGNTNEKERCAIVHVHTTYNESIKYSACMYTCTLLVQNRIAQSPINSTSTAKRRRSHNT